MHFRQLKFTIMFPRLNVVQQTSLLEQSPNTGFCYSRRTRNQSKPKFSQLKTNSLFPVLQSFIHNGAWLEKFTMWSMILEHFPVSRFLLVLQTQDLNFLEHSSLAKNITKSPNLAKLSPKMSPSYQIVAKNVTKLLQALSLQRSYKGRISC